MEDEISDISGRLAGPTPGELDALILDVTQPSPEENSQSMVSSMTVNCGVSGLPTAASSTLLDPFSDDSDVNTNLIKSNHEAAKLMRYYPNLMLLWLESMAYPPKLKKMLRWLIVGF